MSTDEIWNQARRTGQRNAEIIRLAQNWCAHVRVERWGGAGLVEEIEGLPVGMRGFRCKHATTEGGYAGNLEHVVLEFHDTNCVGCPHRKPVGLPNIGSLVAERERTAEARERHATEAREEEARAAQAREAARVALTTSLDRPEQLAIDLIAEWDRRADDATAEKLRQYGLTHPGAFTARVCAELLRAATDNKRRTVVLEVLHRLGVTQAPNAVECAVELLVHSHSDLAAAIVADAAPLALSTTRLIRCAQSLVLVAAPSRDHWARDAGNPAPLTRFYAHHPHEVRRAFRDLLQHQMKSVRIAAVDAVIPLASKDSEFLTWVAGEFVRALGLADDAYNEGSCAGAVAACLGQLLPLYPERVDAAVQQMIPQVSDDAVEALHRIYCVAIHGNRFRQTLDTNSVAHRICLERVLAAAVPSAPLGVLRETTAAIAGMSKEEPASLMPRLEVLLHRCAELITARSTPTASLHDPRPAFLLALEKQNRESALYHAARSIATAAGRIAAAAPSERVPVVSEFALGASASDPLLGGMLLESLGPTAKRAIVRPALTQVVYKALHHESPRLRGAGASLYGDLAAAGTILPDLLHESAVLALQDSFVVVHRAAVASFLRAHWPEEYAPRVAMSCLHLALSYGSGEPAPGRDFVEDVVRLLLKHQNHLPPHGRELVNHAAVGIISRLPVYERLRISRAYIDRFAGIGKFWTSIANATEEALIHEHLTDDWFDVAWSTPPRHRDLVAGALMEEALKQARGGPVALTSRVTELLTRWGRWEAAVRLQAWAEQNTADDKWLEARRAWARALRAAAEAETAMGRGETDRFRAARQQFETATNATAPSEQPDFTRLEAARLRLADAVLAHFEGVAVGDKALADATAGFSDLVRLMTDGEATQAFSAYSMAAEAVLNLARWRAATRLADPSASRFRDAAQLIVDELDAGHFAGVLSDEGWSGVLGALRASDVRDGGRIAAGALWRVRLPMQCYSLVLRDDCAAPTPAPPDRAENAVHASRVSLVIAEIQINGADLHPRDETYLVPGLSHDVSVQITIGRWPDSASVLVLEPIQLEPASVLSCPTFEFAKPSGDPGALITATKHLVVEKPHSFPARPYSVAYQGRFEPESDATIVDVRGGCFRIRAHDPRLEPLTGYTEADDAVIGVRDAVRGTLIPPVADDDVGAFLIMVAALARMAGASLQGHFFKEPIDEKEFQRHALFYLRQDARLGANLVEAAKTAGGITDLSFHGIPVELKVETSKVITVKDGAQYFGQARQYAAGNGKRLGVVAVLECASKKAPPPGLGSDIAFSIVDPGNGHRPFGLATVVVRGNLPRPSSHSP